MKKVMNILNMQITGGPQACMMSVEKPEAIVSVAPAEGQKQLSILHILPAYAISH